MMMMIIMIRQAWCENTGKKWHFTIFPAHSSLCAKPDATPGRGIINAVDEENLIFCRDEKEVFFYTLNHFSGCLQYSLRFLWGIFMFHFSATTFEVWCWILTSHRAVSPPSSVPACLSCDILIAETDLKRVWKGVSVTTDWLDSGM